MSACLCACRIVQHACNNVLKNKSTVTYVGCIRRALHRRQHSLLTHLTCINRALIPGQRVFMIIATRWKQKYRERKYCPFGWRGMRYLLTTPKCPKFLVHLCSCLQPKQFKAFAICHTYPSVSVLNLPIALTLLRAIMLRLRRNKQIAIGVGYPEWPRARFRWGWLVFLSHVNFCFVLFLRFFRSAQVRRAVHVSAMF